MNEQIDMSVKEDMKKSINDNPKERYLKSLRHVLKDTIKENIKSKESITMSNEKFHTPFTL